MDTNEFRQNVLNALLELESEGEIVITTTMPESLANRIVDSVHTDIPNIISGEEASAITNGMNALLHDIRPDNRDFQTIIGIPKDKFRTLQTKLTNSVKDKK